MKVRIVEECGKPLINPEGIFIGSYERKERNTLSKEEYARSHGKSWEEKGFNHKEERGCLVRSFKEDAWFIEVDTLEKLEAIFKQYEDKFLCLVDNDGLMINQQSFG